MKRTAKDSHEGAVPPNCDGTRLEDYILLSYCLAARFNSSVLSFQERQQAALIGIQRGLESFKEGKSSRLHWVFMKGLFAIEEAIQQEIRIRQRFRQIDSGTEEIRVIHSRIRTPLEELIAKEEVIESERQKQALNHAIRRLEPRVRYVVQKVGLEGVSQQLVAKEMNISQSWCSRLYCAGLKKLREILLENEFS